MEVRREDYKPAWSDGSGKGEILNQPGVTIVRILNQPGVMGVGRENSKPAWCDGSRKGEF